MRYFGLLRTTISISSCMLICFVSSCVKDNFDSHQNASVKVAFDVEVSDSWINFASQAATGTSIKKMSQTDDFEPLYLVTDISDLPEGSSGQQPATRGTAVTDANFPDVFGLSAICYTGDWPSSDDANDWPVNFAYNLQVQKNSKGVWEPEEKLEWMGSGRVRFFAYSPYTENSEGTLTHSGKDSKGIPTLTYKVPDEVKSQRDLLCATADCSGNKGGSVKLTFGHVLTAVSVKAGSDMLAGTISEVSISGVYGEGTYRIGSTKWTTGGTTRTFTVKEGISLQEDKTDNDKNIDTKPGTDIISGVSTFMMVPQKLPVGALLTVKFKDNLTGINRTLTADLGGKEWPVGKHVTYSINSTGIVVEPVFEMTVNRDGQWPNGGYKFREGQFDVAQEPMTEADKKAYLPVSGFLRDVDVIAYVKVTQAKAGTEEAKEQKLELPFRIEYSTDGGTTWTTDSKYGWKPASEAKAAGEKVKGSILLPAQPSFTESSNVFDGISTREGKTDWDLTAHNPLSNHSANCYMVHDHGYYKFPAYYGNTYNNTAQEAYSCDLEVTDAILVDKVLKKFVAGDNTTVANGAITGIANAKLIWQDSPDLVTDITFKDGWVHFRVPRESLNQGNAVIAVVDASGTILWNWHIWVTHYDWSANNCIPAGVNNQYNREFMFAPSILGYCTPHGGDEERNVRIRIKATVPGEKDDITIVKPVIKGIVSQPDGKGEIAFTQYAVVASIAGDNTYYQWGRKDPMLPGVYNKEIRDKAGTEEEFDIANKVFYSAPEYRFMSESSTVDIGTTVREPYHFFMHSHDLTSGTPGYDDANYRRRHWHDGSGAAYAQKTIANFWNSQLIEDGKIATAAYPNNAYVFKTVYDPCPAGYKTPPPAAFSSFVKDDTYLGNGKPESAANSFTLVSDPSSGINIGVKLGTRSAGAEVTVPLTGLRDMGLKSTERGIDYGSWPAHSKLTFIPSSGFHGGNTDNPSTLLFSIDRREHTTSATQPIDTPLGVIYGTNNSYGFTVLPIRDGQK